MGFGVQVLGFSALSNALSDLVDIQLKDDVVYVVGTNVEYAIYQEFGTRHQSGQPYLFPAARSVEREMGRVAGRADNVADAVKLVALEIERRAAQNAPVDTGNLQASIRSERIR
jgi:hypothetical protein